MSLLQNTKDKVERFSLEVANQEMEKLRSRMTKLEEQLDQKIDVGGLDNIRNDIRHLDHKLDAFGEKYDHDRECIGNALQHISHILLGLAGVKIDKDTLMGLQMEINELQTRKEYWYDRYSNHASYWN